MVDFSKLNKPTKKESDFLNFHSLDGLNSNRRNILRVNKHRLDEVLEGLNEQQHSMVKGMVEYLSGETDKLYFLAQGGGGTGKSFSVGRALSLVDKKRVLAAAPSHFAKNVLSDFLGPGYEVMTIAKLLGKRIDYDKQGNQILKRISYDMVPPIESYQVILIDEGSMVKDDTAEEILDYIRDGDKYLIVLGDYCQLPPVNQSTDSLFFRDIAFELTQPMRFVGPIFELSMIVRKEIIKIRQGLVPSLNIINIATDRKSVIDSSGSGYVFLNNIGTVLKAVIKRFNSNKGTNYVRVLAYRNKTIDKINKKVRSGLFGENPNQFEPGEQLINRGGYSIKVPGVKNMQRIITNGELFKIRKTELVVGPYDVPCKNLFFYGRKFEVPILVVAEEGIGKYNSLLSDLESRARANNVYWKDVRKFKESFAYFDYSYSTSIHKAQGSSIEYVFVLEDDITAVKPTTSKEKLQSIYTAISRASKRVYIYNKEFKVDNSGLNREYLKIE